MEANFDKAALKYDETFTNTQIGKMQRYLVYHQFKKHLIGIQNILEINCGTGEDAIWLAQQKFSITATDISEKMIAVAKSKSNYDNITFKVADNKTIQQTFKDQQFDLIFSNFGGLNCLSPEEINIFFKNVTSVLSEKGKMILVIMPKNTLWEQFYFLMKLQFSSIFRRKKEKVIANVDGEKVTTYYYNPKEIVNLSKQYFSIIDTKPIGFLVPPSYLEPFFKNKLWLLKFLNTMEKRLKNWGFLSKYADHYIITLQKR